MKPTNPNFWTSTDGKLNLRNLEAEESVYRNNIFPAWKNNIIDEAIVVYYEIYDCHSGNYIDDSLYQREDCYIKKDDTVLDLGANIGIFSRFASDKGAKKIYSFEPVQENFKVLALNIPDNCEAHKLAISNEDNKTVSIAYKPDCPGGSSMLKYDDGILQKCMTMTITTLIKNKLIQQPDFIKMDIEGAETLAFKGITDRILQKTRCIAMEMHNHVIGQEGVDYIYSRLAKLGFTSFTLHNPDNNNIVWFTNKNIK